MEESGQENLDSAKDGTTVPEVAPPPPPDDATTASIPVDAGITNTTTASTPVDVGTADTSIPSISVDVEHKSSGSVGFDQKRQSLGAKSAKSVSSVTSGHKKSMAGSSHGSSTSKEDPHSTAGEHTKSLFQQRKSHHQTFVEAKTSKMPPFAEAKTSKMPVQQAEQQTPASRAISFAPATMTWRQDDDDDDFDELEAETDVAQQLFKHDHTFDKLHEIYQHTLGTLDASDAKGINMEPVKSLFITLWDGIQRSHQNVLRLQVKDHDISVDLSAIMAKTRTLIKLAEEDVDVAARLRAKLESAWGLADVGEAEERKNALHIYELREEIFMLNRSINAAAKTEGQTTVVELTRLKSQFESQKNLVGSEVARLNSELKQIFQKRQDLADLKVSLEEKFKLLSEEEVIYREAIAREKARKERLVKAIAETIVQSEHKAVEVEDLVQNLNLAESRLTDVERYVKEQRIVNEDAQHELEIANNKYIKFKQDYESQARLCDRLAVDLFKRQSDLKEKEDEVASARTMVSRMNRQKEANLRKVQECRAIVSSLEEERENLKSKLALLEKELEIAQKRLEANKRSIDALDRDRAILNRSLERAVAVGDSHEHQRVLHELAVRNLQHDIGGYEKEIAEQQTVIAHLEKERDNYTHEAMKLAHQVAVRLEEARKMDRSIYESQKKLGRVETQLKKQQQVYENAVYEKALTQKQLRDALSEGVENNIKLMHLGHQIMGLKFQVGEKDTVIHIEASRYERVLRETTFYAGEGKRLQHMAYDMQRMVEALMAERLVLKKTVAAIESEMGRQAYYANNAQSRKEVFGRKLMVKEQELRETCEKWRVLHSEIRIGAYHYRNLIADIRKIRLMIFETRKENIVKSFGKRRIRKLQHEISVLENIISKEICMCNSLRESMRHPINVHRWRVLECTNPDAYDMVIKANLLTKRLVDRNAVVRKQDEELAYKQEIYCQIRDALSKAPSLETPENVTYYQHLVAAKQRQYKALQYELQASTFHAQYFDEERELLQGCFKKLERQYFQRMSSNGCSYDWDYPDDDTVFENDKDETLGDPEKSSISIANLAKELPLADASAMTTTAEEQGIQNH